MKKDKEKEKKKEPSFIGLTVFSTAISLLAAVGASKLFPLMMKKCMEKCEQEGFEPPAFCKKMMTKCCSGEKSESPKS